MEVYEQVDNPSSDKYDAMADTDGLREAMKAHQGQFRVQIRRQKTKQLLDKKRQQLMLKNPTQSNQTNSSTVSAQLATLSPSDRIARFHTLLSPSSSEEQFNVIQNVTELQQLLNIDPLICQSVSPHKLVAFVLEPLAIEQTKSDNIIREGSDKHLIGCLSLLCEVYEIYNTNPAFAHEMLLTTLRQHQFIRMIAQFIDSDKRNTPLSNTVLTSMLYCLFVLTEHQSRLCDEMISERIVELFVKQFSLLGSVQAHGSTEIEQFSDSTWIYLIALHSNLAEHSDFPKDIPYFYGNVQLLVSLLQIDIADNESALLLRHQILKSIASLASKDLRFSGVFMNEQNLSILRRILRSCCENEQINLSNTLEIIGCISSQNDVDEILNDLVCKNNNGAVVNFLIDICSADDASNDMLAKKVYLLMLNIVLSGDKCLRSFEDMRLPERFVKILVNLKSESAYEEVLEILTAYIGQKQKARGEDQVVTMALGQSLILLKQFFDNTSVGFRQEVILQQLTLLQLILHSAHSVGRLKEVVQVLHNSRQVQFIQDMQYNQNPKIYEIAQLLLDNYLLRE